MCKCRITNTNTQTHKHTHKQTNTHTYKHTNTHTHTQTLTHSHSHTQQLPISTNFLFIPHQSIGKPVAKLQNYVLGKNLFVSKDCKDFWRNKITNQQTIKNKKISLNKNGFFFLCFVNISFFSLFIKIWITMTKIQFSI